MIPLFLITLLYVSRLLLLDLHPLTKLQPPARHFSDLPLERQLVAEGLDTSSHSVNVVHSEVSCYFS